MAAEYVVEPEKKVPVVYDADVVVAGGGVAGVFAALAVRSGVSPRELDVKVLQRQLLADGFFLGDGDRLEELGLGSS